MARSIEGEPAFALRPDIVVVRDGETRLIIDTKWKRLKEGQNREGVIPADAYQMFAYAERYDARDVVLLYPHHSGLGDWTPRRATYEFGHALGFGKRRVTVSTVDLTALKTVRQQLVQIAQVGALAEAV